jgi:hypothetical protein
MLDEETLFLQSIVSTDGREHPLGVVGQAAHWPGASPSNIAKLPELLRRG